MTSGDVLVNWHLGQILAKNAELPYTLAKTNARIPEKSASSTPNIPLFQVPRFPWVFGGLKFTKALHQHHPKASP